MSIELNWDKLPEYARLGSSPDESIVLYRGFAAHQLDPEKGLLSTAEESGAHHLVEDAIRAIDEDYEISRLLVRIYGPAEKRQKPTPLIYVTPDKENAADYARKEGEKVATIKLEAGRAFREPSFGYFVLGSISPSEIVDIEDGPWSAV